MRHLLMLLLAGLLLPGNRIDAGEFNAVMNIGDSMPQFTGLPATDGSLLSSEDIDAEVVVLVSLANHCPWVRGMDRDLIALVDSLAEVDVRVLGFAVNHREDDRLPAMAKHARRVGYNFDYVFDESQALGRALGATRTPEYFVFNRDRKLVYMGLLHNSPARQTREGEIRHINGEPTEFYVADAVRAVLAGKPVAISETRAHGCTVEYGS